MQEIGPNIYYEDQLTGVTLGALVLPRGVILIDAPLRAEDSHTWNATVLSHTSQNHADDSGEKELASDHVLVYLDAHPDRTIGARILETASQTPIIIAHRETARGFESRPTIFKGQNTDTGADWELCEDVVSTRWALPDLTFTDMLCLQWEQKAGCRRSNAENSSASHGYNVYLEHHPGPAAGAIWVHIPQAKVLFIGDAVLIGQAPFLESADIPRWLDTLDLLASDKYRGYSFISGRGGLVTGRDILTQRKYMERILKFVAALEKESGPPANIDKIVKDILSWLDFPQDRRLLYEQRLRYGLQNYFLRHFPADGYFE
jgi:glyoxylase-like metal-dependent hydrolase (beta-lactamase superfamily II)